MYGSEALLICCTSLSKYLPEKNGIIEASESRFRINDTGFLALRMVFAYQLNENCGLGPGAPGWPVWTTEKDNIYDESEILASHLQH
jgi:hypothetical protein